jgi:hypothetical protein
MKATAHRILGALGLALTGAVLLAGGAQAAERPDDRSGMIGVGGAQVLPATPDVFERAVLRSGAANPVPDVFERAVLRESGSAVRPDDRSGARGPGTFTSPLASASASAADDGFRWDDAFLGAAAMLGAVLLGAAATLTIRHRGGMAVR